MAIDFLTQNKTETLLILGASSMIGSHVVELLTKNSLNKYLILTPSHKELELKKNKRVCEYFIKYHPSYVLNFSGYNGGIKMNNEQGYQIFLYNTEMILNIVRMSTMIGVKKLLSIIPSCSYPDRDGILKEEDYWSGKPAQSVLCHGLAKRNLMAFSEQARKQYDLNACNVCLNTVYGPRDKFGENAKVIGSLIEKFVRAKEENLGEVHLYGDGSQLRGFIYVEDAARAIVECFETYNELGPLNIESEEISIKDLANLIKDEVQYDGHITWTGELGGQKRKMLDFAKSREILKYKPQVSLRDGIKKTIDWYYIKGPT